MVTGKNVARYVFLMFFLIEVFRLERNKFVVFSFLDVRSRLLYLDIRQDTLMYCVLGIGAVEIRGDQLPPTPPLGL